MNAPLGPDWLNGDAGLPLEIREAIRAADREDGTPDQVARLEARLAPLLGLPEPVETSSPAAGSPGSLSAGMLKTLTAAVVLVGAGALIWPQREHVQRSLSASDSAAQVHEASAPAPFLRHIPQEIAPRESELTASPAVAPVAETARHSERAAAVSTLRAEARLLQRAREALAGNPAETMQLVERHEQRFPNGALREEREVIAIKALRAIGRNQAAQSRHARFTRMFPESPHLASLSAGTPTRY